MRVKTIVDKCLYAIHLQMQILGTHICHPNLWVVVSLLFKHLSKCIDINVNIDSSMHSEIKIGGLCINNFLKLKINFSKDFYNPSIFYDVNEISASYFLLQYYHLLLSTLIYSFTIKILEYFPTWKILLRLDSTNWNYIPIKEYTVKIFLWKIYLRMW